MNSTILTELIQLSSQLKGDKLNDSLQKCIYEIRIKGKSEGLIPVLIEMIDKQDKIIRILSRMVDEIHNYDLLFVKLKGIAGIQRIGLLIALSQNDISNVVNQQDYLIMLIEGIQGNDLMIKGTSQATLMEFIQRGILKGFIDGEIILSWLFPLIPKSLSLNLIGKLLHSLAQQSSIPSEVIQSDTGHGHPTGTGHGHPTGTGHGHGSGQTDQNNGTNQSNSPSSTQSSNSIPLPSFGEFGGKFLSSFIIKSHGEIKDYQIAIPLANSVIQLHLPPFNSFYSLECEILDSIWLKLLTSQFTPLALELWIKLAKLNQISNSSQLVSTIIPLISSVNHDTKVGLLESTGEIVNIPIGYSSNLSLILLSILSCNNSIPENQLDQVRNVLINSIQYTLPSYTRAWTIKALQHYAKLDNSFTTTLPSSIYSTIITLANPLDNQWPFLIKSLQQQHSVDSSLAKALKELAVVDDEDVITTLLSKASESYNVISHFSPNSSLNVTVCSKKLKDAVKDDNDDIDVILEFLVNSTHHQGTKSISQTSLEEFIQNPGKLSHKIPLIFKNLDGEVTKDLLEKVHSKLESQEISPDIVISLLLNIDLQQKKIPIKSTFELYQLLIDFLPSIEGKLLLPIIEKFVKIQDLNIVLTCLSTSWPLDLEFIKRNDVKGHFELIEMLIKFIVDDRVEVRNAILPILSSCLDKIIPNHVIVMKLIGSIEKVIEKKKNLVNDGKQDIEISKAGFMLDPLRYFKQWNETCSSLISLTCNVVKKFDLELQSEFLNVVKGEIGDELITNSLTKNMNGLPTDVLEEYLKENFKAVKSSGKLSLNTLTGIINLISCLTTDEKIGLLLYSQIKEESRYSIPIQDYEEVTSLQRVILDKIVPEDVIPILNVCRLHGQDGELHEKGDSTLFKFTEELIKYAGEHGIAFDEILKFSKKGPWIDVANITISQMIDKVNDVNSIKSVIELVKNGRFMISPQKLVLVPHDDVVDFINWMVEKSFTELKWLNVLMNYTSPSSPIEICKIVAPLLLSRLKDTLKKYAREREENDVILDSPLHLEIIHVLSLINDSEFHPAIISLPSRDLIHPTKAQIMTGKKAHLFSLMKDLIECIAGGGKGGRIEDWEVAELIKESLRLIAGELGV